MPTLYRVARQLTLDPTDAEDLVAQALMNAAKGWVKFNGEFARSWLLRILKNCYLSGQRSKLSRPAIVEADVEQVVDEPWGAIDWRLVGTGLADELRRLPEEYRLAVALCDIEELSYEEAASVMEVAVGTAKSRVFRGRRLLRARLARFGADQ